MQDHVVPPLVEPTTEGSLADLPARNAARNPANVLFARKAGERWVDVTAREFHDDVRRLAKGLVAAGVQPGDRVAIMSKTRYEWTLADFAVWTAGGVAVPIYETSSAEQVHWILEDSGAVAIVLETPAHAAIVDEVRDQLPRLKHVVADRGRRPGRADPDRRVGQRCRARRQPRGSRPDLGGHDHLHLGHDRPTQGLPADPRQLHGAVGQRHQTAGAGRVRRGRVHAPLPASGPRLRPVHPGAVRQRRGEDGAHRRHQEPVAGLRHLQTDVHPLGAARVREDLQLGGAEGHRRGQGQDLRHGGRDRHRLVDCQGRGRGRLRPPGQARPVRQAGLRQAAGCDGRSGPLRRLRRRPARQPPRALLPRHRRHRPGGVRPHRDDGSRDGQHAGAGQDRHGRASPARRRYPRRARTARS